MLERNFTAKLRDGLRHVFPGAFVTNDTKDVSRVATDAWQIRIMIDGATGDNDTLIDGLPTKIRWRIAVVLRVRVGTRDFDEITDQGVSSVVRYMQSQGCHFDEVSYDYDADFTTAIITFGKEYHNV